MAEKTLYDILEVSASASPEGIRAAYERLSGKFNTENAADPASRVRHDAVKEAFFTLGNPEKRKLYDAKLARGRGVLENVQVVEPFWSIPKLIVVGLILAVAAGFYHSHQKEQGRLARLETERQIAAAKAKEEEEKARVEIEKARLESQQRRQEQAQEDRVRRERDVALRRFTIEQGNQSAQANRERMQREAAEKRLESQRRTEEMRAHSAAQQQASRDRAELCRIERERYGRALSC